MTTSETPPGPPVDKTPAPLPQWRGRMVHGRLHTEDQADDHAAYAQDPDSTVGPLLLIVAGLVLIAWAWWS